MQQQQQQQPKLIVRNSVLNQNYRCDHSCISINRYNNMSMPVNDKPFGFIIKIIANTNAAVDLILAAVMIELEQMVQMM